jgi:HAD superfamily hydrolase (TIGR01509 family)
VIPRYPVYLFDIDGTLLDSAPDICAAQTDVLTIAGCAPVPFEQLRGYVGLELRAVFRNLIPNCDDDMVRDLSEQYTLRYRARRHAGTRIYPGAREALEMLEGRKSTATTKSTEGTRLVLEHFDLLAYFDHIQGSDGLLYKPAPDVILASVKALGASPEDCLMIGDSPADMEAGRRAGVSTCAVRYGYGDPEKLAALKPDYWVSDLRELVL